MSRFAVHNSQRAQRSNIVFWTSSCVRLNSEIYNTAGEPEPQNLVSEWEHARYIWTRALHSRIAMPKRSLERGNLINCSHQLFKQYRGTTGTLRDATKTKNWQKDVFGTTQFMPTQFRYCRSISPQKIGRWVARSKISFSLEMFNLARNLDFFLIFGPSGFAADRIAPIRSDLRSPDSNRKPKFRSIRCDVFTIFQMLRLFQIARFGSLADPDSNRAHRDI